MNEHTFKINSAEGVMKVSLRYIMGGSGTGKTTQCINEIACRNNLEERIFYIVPEQFTLESEKNLLSKKKSLININILGFKHFAYYLISKMGTSGRAMLDDTGRAMLIKKIVLELKNKLEFYKNSVDKQGFIDNLDMTITELMQYSMSPEKISLLISGLGEGNLKNKLKDIYLIFSKYREYLSREYISGDGALDLLAEFIKGSVVEGSEVWIDGFKSFTPQEGRVIEQLLKYCRRVNIVFTINPPAAEYGKLSNFDEQYEVKKTINHITELARENNIEIENIHYMSKNYKKYNEEIEFLKNNYFKYRFTPYDNNISNIKIYRANNLYQEIDKICCEIKGLVQNKGYRYKDIALIIGSDDYEIPLACSLKKYDIPNFLDSRKSIVSHPVAEFITAAVDIIAYNWNNNDVFKLLKTGFTDISFERIYSLENYVRANGIDKYKWNKEWKYGFKSEEKGIDKPDKEYIEETRNMLFEILLPLKENYNQSRKAEVRDITESIYKVLENVSATEKIQSEVKNAEEKGDVVKASVNREIWNVITDVTEKMVSILGNEKVTLREYSKILKSGLSTVTIGIAPPAQDYLIVGDMERTRLSDIKAMFVVGANDGNIPVRMTEKGIFTDDEKAVMEDNNVELAPRIVQMTNNGRLGIYFNLIKATDYLCLSYPTGSIKGEGLKPSGIISKIQSLFPKLSEEIVSDTGSEKEILSGKSAAFDKLIQAVGNEEDSEFLKELYLYYKNDDEYGKKIRQIKDGIFSQIPQSYLDEKLIPNLWDRVLSKGSVSKLEKFTGCPFKFYMEYILRAREKEIYKLKNNDIGILSHRVMEEFSKYITERGIDWNITNKEYTDAFVDTHISQFVNEMNTDIFESNRNSAILNKIKQAAKFALWANVEQIKASKFKPENFEISFGRRNSKIPAIEIEIDNGKILRLNGVIDRVDKMLKEDGSVYVKIVDYKSSAKKLDINKIYNGLQLQLALYMDTLVENMKVKPAGMFYFEVNEPKLIDKEKGEDSSENAMLKRMALNGMYDEGLAEELNTAFIEKTKGKSKETVRIPRDISEKESEILTDEKMDDLLKYSKLVVKNIGREIAKGNIEISPYKYGTDEDSCKFCPYGAVCDFENSSKEKLRSIGKSNKDLWEEIHNKVNEE